jgi:glycosyltransferase involved in cell wall biosynthesis
VRVPTVSVVIPTRDRPEFLRQAIASVRAQTFSDYEIVVVINGPDNPGTPSTIEVAKGCRIERIAGSGIAVALNAGIAAARGEWIAMLDDDDLWEPDWLETALAVAARTQADVIFGDLVLFDEAGGVRGPRLRPPPHLSAREAMILKCYSGCSAAFVRRSALQAVGGFDPAFKSPDYDLWMRLAWNFPVAWADAYLVWVRQHTQNTSKALSWAGSTIPIQWKALRTMPRDLRHMRPRLMWTMLNVLTKSAESHVRRTWLRRFRKPKPALCGDLKPPIAGEPRGAR